MSPPPEDQQLRWSVSPSGSKLDSLKHVFNLLSFQEPSRAEVCTVKSLQQLYFIQEASRRDWCGDGARPLLSVVVVMRLS